MASLNTLEPCGAAGRQGLLLGTSWWAAEPATAKAPCRGNPSTSDCPREGRKKRGMLFTGRVAEVLKLPVTVFWKGKYSRR